jgi:lipid-A-disaccharide synthase
MAGRASALSGVERVVDGDRLAVMGLSDVVGKLPRVWGAWQTLRTEAIRRRPSAALLVGFTEFNQRLGRWLRARGTRVVWCGAPQVWAWRSSRLHTLRDSADRLAVMLPFERELWRSHGHDAEFVGHPCVEASRWSAPRQTGKVAVLCGSRASEVHRTGTVLLEAAALWVSRHRGWRAETIEAQGLDPRVSEALHREAARWSVQVVKGDPIEGAAPLLADFDLAFCVSGTASLEAAVSGTPPVVAYRFDALTAAVATRLVKTPHIALPNIVLSARSFPELVQGDVTAERIVREAQGMLSQGQACAEACKRVREAMTIGDGMDFGERVAAML